VPSNAFRVIGGVAVATALLLTAAITSTQNAGYNAMPGTGSSKYKT
jgi:hypothetical protein